MVAVEQGARPLARQPVGAARIAVDVASHVARGSAVASVPGVQGQGLEVLRSYLHVAYVGIAGETRRWLYMHPPARAEVDVRVPHRAFFQAGLGVGPGAWHADQGDGVRFIVEAQAASGRRLLLDRHVNSRARAEDRRWLNEWVDLSALAGQQVRLILRTDAGGDTAYDWAGWSNPQIVIWDSPRPHPGTPHPW
jgi:hypothetical protein